MMPELKMITAQDRYKNTNRQPMCFDILCSKIPVLVDEMLLRRENIGARSSESSKLPWNALLRGVHGSGALGDLGELGDVGVKLESSSICLSVGVESLQCNCFEPPRNCVCTRASDLGDDGEQLEISSICLLAAVDPFPCDCLELLRNGVCNTRASELVDTGDQLDISSI